MLFSMGGNKHYCIFDEVKSLTILNPLKRLRLKHKSNEGIKMGWGNKGFMSYT